MLLQGLNVMHNSPFTPNPLREELGKFIEDQDDLCGSDRPPSARIYPPVGTLDFDVLLTRVGRREPITSSLPSAQISNFSSFGLPFFDCSKFSSLVERSTVQKIGDC